MPTFISTPCKALCFAIFLHLKCPEFLLMIHQKGLPWSFKVEPWLEITLFSFTSHRSDRYLKLSCFIVVVFHISSHQTARIGWSLLITTISSVLRLCLTYGLCSVNSCWMRVTWLVSRWSGPSGSFNYSTLTQPRWPFPSLTSCGPASDSVGQSPHPLGCFAVLACWTFLLLLVNFCLWVGVADRCLVLHSFSILSSPRLLPGA